MRNQATWERLWRETPEDTERSLRQLEVEHGISRDEAIKMVDDRMDSAASKRRLAAVLWIFAGVVLLVLLFA